MNKTRQHNVIKHSKNPFLTGFELELKQKKMAVGLKKDLMDLETGLMVSPAILYQVKKYDDEQFIKVFKGKLKHFFSLTNKAMKVMEYIFFEVQKRPNEDRVYLGWHSANEYFNEVKKKCSRTTYIRAMTELMQNGFLARTLDINMYFINPALFFNGDRAVFVDEIRRMSIDNKPENVDRDPKTIDMFQEEENGQPN